ncbi:MAG: glycosyltransferase [Myxococcota bacterium]
MARVLIYTSPARGHLYPAAAIGLELMRRGHYVELHGLSQELAPLREAGLCVRGLDAAIEALPLDDGKAWSAVSALRRVMATFVARAPHEVRSLDAALSARPPDCLLIDVNCLGAAALAERSALPWATFAPYCLPIPSRDAPPFGLGLLPRRDWLGRLRDGCIQRITRGALASFTEPVNQVRRALSVPALTHAADFALTSPRLLALTSEAFEYPRSDWPNSVRLCGHCCWAPPDARAEPFGAENEEYVLVTASTEAQRDARLLQVALDALADVPQRVVVTTGAHDPSRFRAPPNARVVRFASHATLLPRAQAVICHGGMGITQRALSHGVPVCVVPAGRDQFEVARRVERAQAGVFLHPRRLSAGNLRRAFVRTVAARSGAQKLAPTLCPRQGAERAANELISLIRG